MALSQSKNKHTVVRQQPPDLTFAPPWIGLFPMPKLPMNPEREDKDFDHPFTIHKGVCMKKTLKRARISSGERTTHSAVLSMEYE